MVTSHRLVEVPSHWRRFSGASRRVFIYLAANTAPHRSHLFFFSPFSARRGFIGRLDTRAVYTLFFSRSCKSWRRLCAKKHEQEVITMFLPSDEGSSNSPSTRFSPRYAISLSHCALAGPSIYSLAHARSPRWLAQR